MHVPGVKQEQPDRRPSSSGPLKTNITVRDEHNTRVAKISNESPAKVIVILNSLMTKTNGSLFVDTVVHDGGNNRILKMTGEKDTTKVIRILNKLIKQTRTGDLRCQPPPLSQPDVVTEEDDVDFGGGVGA